MKEEALRRLQGKRLRIARELAGFRSARDAALSNEWPESSYRAHEGGTRTIGLDDADKYARKFGTTTAKEILFGSPDGSSPMRQVPLKGRIGAGGEIEAIDDGSGDTVEAPIDADPETVAGIVKGLSMMPVYEEDTILYWSRLLPPDSMINKRCVAQLGDGRIMVKKLVRGSEDGLWTLVSVNPAYPDIENVVVEWVAKIDWTKPA